MPTLQEKVGKARFEDIENAWILVSATWKEQSGPDRMVTANMSFFYDAGEIAVEWEPEHGPIQTWYKCDADHEKAKPHYFYDYVIEELWAWSQISVDRYQLPAAFERGDYAYIFTVLRNWAESR